MRRSCADGAKRRSSKSHAARTSRSRSSRRRWPARRRFTSFRDGSFAMDMRGKTVLVTGSTDGVGRYVAAKLAAAGARVLVHGRDRARAEALIEEIRRHGQGGAVFYQADLASMAGARQLADAVLADHRRLDLLISNAGIGARPGGGAREISVDGVELRFAVNYLAGFLLVQLLLPLL